MGYLPLTPNTSFTYSSQNKHDVTPYGYGWDINIPYISRVNIEGTNHMYAGGHDFFSSLSGDELKRQNNISTSTNPNEDGHYFALRDDTSFYKHVFLDGFWKVTGKDGKAYYFGESSSTREINPNYTGTTSAQAVYKWYLDRVVDVHGNVVDYSYTYATSSGLVRPTRIEYAKEPNNTNFYAITFNYSSTSRAYDSIRSTAGFTQKQEYILTSLQVLKDESPIATYTFSYTTNTTNDRTFLDSYTVARVSDAGITTTLPATSFEYTKTAPGFTLASGFDELPIIDTESLFNGSYNMPVVTYTREDGRQAIAGYYTEDLTTGTDFHYYYNPATQDWVSDPTRGEGNEIFDTFFNEWKVLAELNGDISMPESISLGNNSMPDSIEGIIDGYSTSQYKDYIYLADVNGDGYDDLYFFDDLGNNAVHSFYGGGATSYTNNNFWDVATWGNGIDTMNRAYQDFFMDMNGDGLADQIENEEVFMNVGTGFTSLYSYSSQNPFNTLTFEESAWRYHDVNGDGLVDILESENGGGQTAVHFQRVDGTFDRVADYIPVQFARDDSDTVVGNGVWFFDIDGDGYLDIIKTTGEDNQEVYLNNAEAVDLLYKVEESAGHALEVTYDRTTEMYNATGSALLNPDLPFGIDVVTKIQASADASTNWYDLSEYVYTGAAWYSSSQEQKFAGFELITETSDEQGRITKSYFHQGDEENVANYEPSDNRDVMSKMYREATYATSGLSISEKNYDWDITQQWGTDVDPLTEFVYVKDVFTSDNTGIGTSTRDTRTYFEIERFTGELQGLYQYGETLFTKSTWAFTDVATDTKRTTYTYADNINAFTSPTLFSTDYIFAPSSIKTRNNDFATVTLKSLIYDNQATDTLTIGLVTKSSDWLGSTSSSQWLDNKYTYNTAGLLTRVVDPRGATTTFAFDAYNLFPASTTNPLSQVTYFTTDYNTGGPATTTDPNNRKERTRYDGLGRPIEKRITTPSGGMVTIATWTYDDASYPRKVTQAVYSTTTPAYLYQYFDGFGRLIQERKTTTVSGEYGVVTYSYDGAGRITSETLPYTSNTTAYQSSVPGGTKYVYRTYDALDRPRTITTPTGQMGYTYAGWNETVRNENNIDTTFVYDAHGNTSKVVEDIGTTTATTTYAYDTRDLLIGITDTLGNVRTFAYDSLGRKTSLEMPHATATPASSFTYTYDNTGNILTETLPDGAVITYAYDLLARPLTKDSNRATGMEATYTYDTAQYGIGKLTKVQVGQYSRTYGYDQAGNVIREVVTYPYATFGQVYHPTSGGTGGPGPEFAEMEAAYQDLLVEDVSLPIEETLTLVEEEVSTFPDGYEGVGMVIDDGVEDEITTEELETSHITEVELSSPEILATTTETVFEPIPEETPTTTLEETVPEVIEATTTTEEVSIKEETVDVKPVEGKLINSAKEAQVWQDFHNERVESIMKMSDWKVPQN